MNQPPLCEMNQLMSAQPWASDGNLTINTAIHENTGNIKEHGEFNLAGDDEEAKFINGLFDSYTLTANQPEPKTGDMEVYPLSGFLW
jgi:hypothetical protein